MTTNFNFKIRWGEGFARVFYEGKYYKYYPWDYKGLSAEEKQAKFIKQVVSGELKELD